MNSFDFDTEFENLMKTNDLDTVVVLGHMNPDGDAVGSVMGISHYIKAGFKNYRVFPYLSEKMPKGVMEYVKEDKVFDPLKKPEADRYLVLVCDTATVERIYGREYYENALASMVIDHHAANEGHADVNHTRRTEACAELFCQIISQARIQTASRDIGKMPTAAEYLYMGILHDTDHFKRAKAETLSAGAMLLSLGVDHARMLKTMQTDCFEELKKRSMLFGLAEKSSTGKVAVVFLNHKQCKELSIAYNDIHPVSGMLRDCADIEVGMTMHEMEPGDWKISCRSDGKTVDVNKILLKFGGGGHAGAAGLRLKTDHPEELMENILQEIGKCL